MPPLRRATQPSQTTSRSGQGKVEHGACQGSRTPPAWEHTVTAGLLPKDQLCLSRKARGWEGGSSLT